jgi:trimeric autotransporter adhesin
MPLTTVGTSMISSGGGSVATNTALGNSSLAANTTGSFNDAFGSNAAASNTTGTNISAFGAFTLNKNTTGIVNSAFGGSNTIPALYNNTTGSYNCAFGTGALFSNTTSNNNTAVGYQAGYSNTTGTRNAFFGDGAGFTQTGASGNTFIGRNAGRLTTGQGNTFVGFEAGYSVTTGNNNTFIGPAYAGINGGVGDVMTTGSNNVIIGRFTGNQSGLDIRTANNRIVLSDGDGNPRGIFDSDGSFYVGLTPPPGYGGNAAYVITYLGSTRPGIRFYDTLTGSSPSTVQNFVRNGSSVGQIYTTDTATAYVTSSDYRLKENVTPMTGALAKVSQLKPCTYTWKSSGSAGQGFIAHELQEVVPEGVYGEKDGVDKDGNPEYQGIDTSFLVATLTAAIQEQQAIITDLKARIETLEAK